MTSQEEHREHAPSLRALLLGDVQIIVDGVTVTGFRTSKTLALFCYLICTRQPQSRHVLASLFWSDEPEEKAKNSLRVALSSLNQLRPGLLAINRLTVALQPGVQVWSDWQVLDIAAGDLQLADRDLAEVAALYRGELLAGLTLEGAPLFAAWLHAERKRLAAQAARLLAQLADRQMAARDFAAAAKTLADWVAIEPWAERAHCLRMLALARSGDLPAALAQYERCRAVLLDTLDAAPAYATTALHERIVAAQTPQRISVPHDPAPFVGRENELVQLDNMLDNPACRLITITGMGGMGKTRLALAVAQRAGQAGTAPAARLFLHGVAWVPLAEIAHTNLLGERIAAAVGAPLSVQQTALDDLTRFLANKELLIVLDNFEHLIDAAHVLVELLQRCPYVKLLVTSREPLELAAEWRLDLSGLPCPPNGVLADDTSDDPCAAVKLFTVLAQQVQPGFGITESNRAAVYRLCRATNGHPLALKLAVPWLAVRPIERIAAEIERDIGSLWTERPEIPERHRSLRALFDYTWAILRPDEREAFVGLSVFRGGCEEEAAAAVVEASPFALAGLNDRGLIYLEPAAVTPRYLLHELAAQYARSRLSEYPGIAQGLPIRHAAYYAAAAGRRYAELSGTDQLGLAAELSVELDNLRAAWNWAVEAADSGLISLLVGCVVFALDTRGYCAENSAGLSRAIRRLETSGSQEPGLLAHLWVHAGWARLRTGLLNEADEAFGHSHALLTKYKLQPRVGLGTDPQIGASVLAATRGFYTTAVELAHTACDRSRDHTDLANLAAALHALAGAHRSQGMHTLARQAAQEALALAEQTGNHWFAGKVLYGLGSIALQEKALDVAEAYFLRSSAVAADFRAPEGKTLAALGLGYVALARGRYPEAQQRFTTSAAAAAATDNQGGIVLAKEGIGRTAVRLSDGAAARSALRQALAIAHERRLVAPALRVLAAAVRVLHDAERQEEAARVAQLVAAHPASEEDVRREALAALSPGNSATANASSLPPDLELEHVIELTLSTLQALE